MEPQAKLRKAMDLYGKESWDVLPVLSDEQSRDTEWLPAYAAPTIDKIETSCLVKVLSLSHPLPGLQHIKKGSGLAKTRAILEVVVCLAKDEQKTDASKEVTLVKLHLHILLTREIWEIPASPQLTRPQFEKTSKYWPTSFHEDKQVTSALTGLLVNADHKAKMQEYMMVAIQAAKSGQERGMDAVSLVIVNLQSEQFVAMDHDCRNGSHTLHYTVMVCTDLVACGQSRGTHNYEKYPACYYSSRQAISNAKETDQTYICNGYELYITREPCDVCNGIVPLKNKQSIQWSAL